MVGRYYNLWAWENEGLAWLGLASGDAVRRRAQPDDHLHPLYLSALGERRKARDRHRTFLDIEELAGLGIVKMVVGRGIGVVHHARGIDHHLTNQALLREHTEGIVDCGLGDMCPIAIHEPKHVLGRKMYPPIHKKSRNLDALGRGIDPMAPQEVGKILTGVILVTLHNVILAQPRRFRPRTVGRVHRGPDPGSDHAPA